MVTQKKRKSREEKDQYWIEWATVKFPKRVKKIVEKTAHRAPKPSTFSDLIQYNKCAWMISIVIVASISTVIYTKF